MSTGVCHRGGNRHGAAPLPGRRQPARQRHHQPVAGVEVQGGPRWHPHQQQRPGFCTAWRRHCAGECRCCRFRRQPQQLSSGAAWQDRGGSRARSGGGCRGSTERCSEGKQSWVRGGACHQAGGGGGGASRMVHQVGVQTQRMPAGCRHAAGGGRTRRIQGICTRQLSFSLPQSQSALPPLLCVFSPRGLTRELQHELGLQLFNYDLLCPVPGVRALLLHRNASSSCKHITAAMVMYLSLVCRCCGRQRQQPLPCDRHQLFPSEPAPICSCP